MLIVLSLQMSIDVKKLSESVDCIVHIFFVEGRLCTLLTDSRHFCPVLSATANVNSFPNSLFRF